MPVSKDSSQFTVHRSQLLFVHGWATDSKVWQYQGEEFSRDYEVVAIDLIGHDGKDNGKDIWDEPTLRPAVKKVLSCITHSPLPPFSSPTSGGRIGRGVIGIGWSLGGQVLLEAAATHANIFKGLVLVGSSPCFVARKDFPWGQSPGVAKRMLKDLKKDFTGTMNRFYPLNFTEEELKSPAAGFFTELYQREHADHFRKNAIAALETLMALDQRDALPKITLPVIIVHGEQDQICPVEAGRYLAKNLPHARIEVFQNTGHAPFVTRSEEFNALVKGFLEDRDVKTEPLVR